MRIPHDVAGVKGFCLLASELPESYWKKCKRAWRCGSRPKPDLPLPHGQLVDFLRGPGWQSGRGSYEYHESLSPFRSLSGLWVWVPADTLDPDNNELGEVAL